MTLKILMLLKAKLLQPLINRVPLGSQDRQVLASSQGEASLRLSLLTTTSNH